MNITSSLRAGEWVHCLLFFALVLGRMKLSQNVYIYHVYMYNVVYIVHSSLKNVMLFILANMFKEYTCLKKMSYFITFFTHQGKDRKKEPLLVREPVQH